MSERVPRAGIQRRVCLVSGFAVTGLGGLAMVGCLCGWPVLGSFGADYYPMAPNTALLFLTLGIALAACVVSPSNRLARTGIVGAGLASVLLPGLTLFRDLTGQGPDVQALFMRTNGSLGLAPRGHMSLITAGCFILVGLAVLCWVRRIVKATSCLGTAVALVGAVTAMGYLYGQPLLYGGSRAPVALPTGLALMALGAGLAALAGEGLWPLRGLSDPSTRARLLRAFLPVILGGMVLEGWVDARFVREGSSVAVIVSAMASLAALLIGYLVVHWVSKSMGEDVDRIQTELKQHREHLDSLVEDRTAELALANDQLRGEIAERKRLEEELREAKLQSDAASRAKSAFVATMSHEIRTPLNAVLGLAHLLRQTSLDPRQRGYAERIGTAGQALLGIISDVLDVAKVEAGRLELQSAEFHLSPLVLGVAEVAQGRADEKGLSLLLDLAANVPEHLVGDPVRLGQVLANLVSNAVKFTHRGEVVLSVHLVHRDDSVAALRFEVRDTGIGIDETQIPLLFRPFSQLGTADGMTAGGTGLGLAISRAIVRLMGGDILVESRLGEGSRFAFTVTLPLHSSASCESLLDELAIEGGRVLIVDGQPAPRRIEEQVLRSFRLRPTAVASAEEALRELREASADDPYLLVFVGCDSLAETCVERVRRIVESEEGTEPFSHDGQLPGGSHAGEKGSVPFPPAPPVLVWLCFGDRNLEVEVERAGAAAVIHRPFTPSVLLDAIVRALGREESIALLTREPTVPFSPGADAFTGVRALVADDNEVNCLITRELLESWGASVECVYDGAEAVSAARTCRFDIVVMDVQMPVLDGHGATHQIRQDLRLTNLPIIAMSAGASEEDRVLAMRSGMNGYVVKPVDPSVFFDVVRRWTRPEEKGTEPFSHEERWEKGTEPFSHEEQLPGRSHPGEKGSVPFSLPVPFSPALDGIDTVAGVARMGGDQALYVSLLRKFAGSHAQAADRIAEATGAEDLPAVRTLAHGLRGVAATLGATALADAAAGIERAAAAADAGRIPELVDALSGELGRVIRALSSLPEEEVEGGSAGGGVAEAQELVVRLRPLLAASDTAATRVATALTRCVLPPEQAALAREVSVRAMDYDFVGALEALARLDEALAPGDGLPGG